MYDAVIVGGSLAGLYVGWKLAQTGWKTCIVERRLSIGKPVRCGEATGNRVEIERFIPLNDAWIAVPITGLAVHVGDSFSISRRIPEAGLMLHRDRLEEDLAQRAATVGADIRLGTSVISLCGNYPNWNGVRVANGEVLSARLIVGADGAESRVGQWGGLCAPLTLAEAFSAVQVRVASDFCNDGLLHFWIGNEIVGPGYIWVFPKGSGEISVGAGLYGAKIGSRTALPVLEQFMKRYLGGAPHHLLVCGCVPVTVCPRQLHRGNIVIVGDAARQANPLTAGGIMNTLEAGDLLVKCLSVHGLQLSHALTRYSASWRRRMRFEQKIFLLLQRVLLDCSDHEVCRLLERANHLFAHMAENRSVPFRWPISDMLRLGLLLGPKACRHLRLLLT